MNGFEEDFKKALLEGVPEEEMKELAEEKSMFQELGALYKGKQKVPVLINYFGLAFFFGVGIFSLVKFLTTENTQEIAIYSVLLLLSFLSVFAYKSWLWMQMSKNAIVREILRLELRIQEIQKALEKK